MKKRLPVNKKPAKYKVGDRVRISKYKQIFTKGYLPATLYVITRLILSMTNDNCRKFNHNQIMFCICPYIAENERPVEFGEHRLRRKGSLAETFFFCNKSKVLNFDK